MRRAVLGLCLAGLLFAVPIGHARALDGGVFSGRYHRTSAPYLDGVWAFSRISFEGTLSSGSNRYTGLFHIVAGLIGRETEAFECTPSDVMNLTPRCGPFSGDYMDTFSTVAIRGDNAVGPTLRGNCGGKQSHSYPVGGAANDGPTQSFHFRCSISVGGSPFKPVVINGIGNQSVRRFEVPPTCSTDPSLENCRPRDPDGIFAATYTAAAP